MKLHVPHTYVLLVGLIALAALSTWHIPAGSYDRVMDKGREIVDPLSYHPVEAKPAGLGAFFLAFPRGLAEISGIVFYIFISAARSASSTGRASSSPASARSSGRSAAVGRSSSRSSRLSSPSMSPLGLIIAGTVAETYGVQTWFIVGGIATILMGAAGFFIPAVMRFEEGRNAPEALQDSHQEPATVPVVAED